MQLFASFLRLTLAVTALTATAQNTYTLNFDPVLLSEELAKENVKIDNVKSPTVNVKSPTWI